MVSSYFKGSSNEKQSLPFHFLSFFFFNLWHKYAFSAVYYSTWPTVKDRFLSHLYVKKINNPSSHCHHNEILSMCQEAAKVPNKCIAKLSICGFLGVALAANGLSVRALFQKALRFVCCWFFLETCGFVTSAAIIGPCCCIASYYPELRRIVFGNRMLTFSYSENLQVGPSSAPHAWGWWWASLVRSSSSCYDYLLSRLGKLYD